MPKVPINAAQFLAADRAISVKVPITALHGSLDSGLRKQDFITRHLPIHLTKRVAVEASEEGTNDSVFFAPEAPSADRCRSRVTPTQFIKVRPDDHDDIVYLDDDFEVSFVGMSVTPHDVFGANDLLLCSFTSDDAPDMAGQSQGRRLARGDSLAVLQDSAASTDLEEESEIHASFPARSEAQTRTPKKSLGDLPSSLRVGENDNPFIHYDPVTDGHDMGNLGDTFVTIPGTKRLYKQKRAEDDDGALFPSVFIRFTVMEIDSISNEQLSAIRNIDEISGSVSKAASAVPYLKIVSWMLKFANQLGKTALKKISAPDHVMSEDIRFQIARRESGRGAMEYGNYLRYGYYFFLSKKVDAKLYVQTGSSSQTVPLLMKRQGYKAKMSKMNEKEYFVLTGVSYVAIKVSKGCSPVHGDRKAMIDNHRERLAELLAKYKSKEEIEAEEREEREREQQAAANQ